MNHGRDKIRKQFPLCKKMFATQETMKIYLKLNHSEEKQFACKSCKKLSHEKSTR